jgi:hypothetical protein
MQFTSLHHPPCGLLHVTAEHIMLVAAERVMLGPVPVPQVLLRIVVSMRAVAPCGVNTFSYPP